MLMASFTSATTLERLDAFSAPPRRWRSLGILLVLHVHDLDLRDG